ncbi:MAG: agmatine deiminase family protein [Novosphingobium sp.]
MAGRGPDQRPHRRPCGQPRPFRRAERDGPAARHRGERSQCRDLCRCKGARRGDGRNRARSPLPRTGGDGRIEPASYMNFAITSKLVVVPTYGTAHDADGVAAIAQLFPDRETVGILADAVLAGGGSFHCSSQQMPART